MSAVEYRTAAMAADGSRTATARVARDRARIKPGEFRPNQNGDQDGHPDRRLRPEPRVSVAIDGREDTCGIPIPQSRGLAQRSHALEREGCEVMHELYPDKSSEAAAGGAP